MWFVPASFIIDIPAELKFLQINGGIKLVQFDECSQYFTGEVEISPKIVGEHVAEMCTLLINGIKHKNGKDKLEIGITFNNGERNVLINDMTLSYAAFDLQRGRGVGKISETQTRAGQLKVILEEIARVYPAAKMNLHVTFYNTF